MVGLFYVWQLGAYGSDFLDSELPAEVWRLRLTPTTPQGDFVRSFPTAREADAALETLAAEERAKRL